MEALGRQLMDPDLLRDFVGAFTAEWNRQATEAGLARRERRQALEEVERRIANLVDAIADGVRAPGVAARLDELEGRRAEITPRASMPSRRPPPPCTRTLQRPPASRSPPCRRRSRTGRNTRRWRRPAS